MIRLLWILFVLPGVYIQFYLVLFSLFSRQLFSLYISFRWAVCNSSEHEEFFFVRPFPESPYAMHRFSLSMASYTNIRKTQYCPWLLQAVTYFTIFDVLWHWFRVMLFLLPQIYRLRAFFALSKSISHSSMHHIHTYTHMMHLNVQWNDQSH